jgi:galactose mutarotase-like enzyme
VPATATMPRFACDELDGIERIRLENETISLQILPSIGGKIISLRSQATGREFLLAPRRPYMAPAYDGAFDAFDFSGWDECYPAIARGPHPDEPWKGTIIPDHGEVWTLPWSWQYRDGVLRMATHGVRFPYKLERRLDLRTPDALIVRYRATNLSPFPFRCLWSPHPMLGPSPSWRIELPALRAVRIDSCGGIELGGYLDEVGWPTAAAGGREVRIDTVGPAGQGYAFKVYATGLKDGTARVHDTATGETLSFEFSVAELPYAGLAVATGKPGPDQAVGYYVVLEPCNGWPDSLATAATAGECITLPPHGQRTWGFRVRIAGTGTEG